MTRSDNIDELAKALALAQAKITGAKKDSTNPHYNSKYADLASVWDACRGPLTANGISIIQMPRLIGEPGAWLVEVETMMLHTSGQFISDTLAVPVSKPDAQGVGSAITYARRYPLAAFVSVAPEDDDANAASETFASDPYPHAERMTPPAGPLTVKRVLQEKTKKPGTTRYIVTFTDGYVASTIRTALGQKAMLFEVNKTTCRVVGHRTPFGNDLDDIQATVTDDAPTLPPEIPLDVDSGDIPF